MRRNPHDKKCGRCGGEVREAHIDGKKAESCICLISFYDELMPDSWYFEYESKSVSPTAD